MEFLKAHKSPVVNKPVHEDKPQNALASRIRYAREKLGVTQSELGRRCGLSRASVSQYELGAVKELKMEKLVKMALALEMDAVELATGKPSPAEVGTARHPIYQVPIIKDNELPELDRILATPHLQEDRLHMSTTKKVGDRAFSMEVTGDEMVSVESPFRSGGFIIVDPDRQAESGDCVVATIDNGEAMFRQLRINGKRHYLRPFNTQYAAVEVIEGKYNVEGVAVQFTTDILNKT